MTTHFLERPHGTLAYRQTGPTDGRPVLMAHGMGDGKESFRFLAATLAEAGCRVVTTDLRGYGESSLGWPEYTVAATAADLIALIEHLGGPAVVAGHSFAAGSAVMAAGDRPDLIDGLLLLGPAVRHTKPGFAMRQLSAVVTRVPALWTMFYKWLHPGARPADFDAYLAHLKSDLKRPGRMVPIHRVMASFTEHPAPDLSAARAPALIVMGDKDADFDDPTAEAHRIAAGLAGPARAVVLPGAGHYPHVDAPEATGAAVLEFLQQN